MKKRRLAFLLTVVLALACSFGACNGGSSDVKKYFDQDAYAKTAYSSVTRLDGDLCATNLEHNLIALKTEVTSPSGEKSVTIKVVNALTGSDLHSETEYFNDNTFSFNVELDKYPLIVFEKVVEETDGSSSLPTNVSYYDYYLVKSSGGVELLMGGTKEVLKRYNSYVNSVMTFSIGNTTYWVNSKGEVIRELLSAVTEIYGNPNYFYAEYNDYLYDWVLPNGGSTSGISNRIQVFNKDGVCNVQYVVPATVFSANAFVLNNGNVFVQEYELALEGKDHNCVFDMGGIFVNANVKSKIINYQSGEVTELDLGFVVYELESAYDAKNSYSSFSFVLAEGYHNQAIVVDFDATGYSARSRYVVLDNLMNVECEVTNDTISANSFWAYGDSLNWMGKDHYYTEFGDAEGEYLAVFDLEGKATLKLNLSSLIGTTDDYVVTYDAIYNVDGKMVYDFNQLIAGDNGSSIKILGNNVYVSKTNHVTGCTDVYQITVSKGKGTATLVAEGINDRFYSLGNSVVLYDLEMGISSFISQDGTVLLKVKGDIEHRTTVLNDTVIITDVVNGEDVCYVIK